MEQLHCAICTFYFKKFITFCFKIIFKLIYFIYGKRFKVRFKLLSEVRICRVLNSYQYFVNFFQIFHYFSLFFCGCFKYFLLLAAMITQCPRYCQLVFCSSSRTILFSAIFKCLTSTLVYVYLSKSHYIYQIDTLHFCLLESISSINSLLYDEKVQSQHKNPLAIFLVLFCCFLKNFLKKFVLSPPQ